MMVMPLCYKPIFRALKEEIMSNKEFTASVLAPIVTQDVLNNASINSSELAPTATQTKPNETILILMLLVVFGFGGIPAIGCYYRFKKSRGTKEATLVAVTVGLFSNVAIWLILFLVGIISLIIWPP
jgi:hypothetical protein